MDHWWLNPSVWIAICLVLTVICGVVGFISVNKTEKRFLLNLCGLFAVTATALLISGQFTLAADKATAVISVVVSAVLLKFFGPDFISDFRRPHQPARDENDERAPQNPLTHV